jgi:hypothetical protein
VRIRALLLGTMVLVAVAAAFAGGSSASSPSAGPAIASGQVVDKAGRPAAGNVTAYAWPVKAGSHRLRRVASARAGADGRFRLRTTNAALLQRLGRHDGSTDVILVTRTAGAVGDTVFSSRVVRDRGDAFAAGGALGAGAGLGSVPRVRVKATHRVPAARASAVPCQGGTNGVRTKRLKGYKRRTIIGELNNAYKSATARFTYGQKADTQVSVGVSETGKAGTWSIDGSRHVGNSRSAEVSVPRRGPYSRRMYSNFIYGKYRILATTCGITRVSYKLRADKWSGGLSSRPQRRAINICTGGNNYPGRGGTFSRSSNRAVTWKRGASLLGVGLSVRSGFSQYVKTSFVFHGKGPYRLCGSAGRPETEAGRVFSGKAR